MLTGAQQKTHRLAHARALAEGEPRVFWLDDSPPEPSVALAGGTECDLAVIGGGFTGLWPALLAKERDPTRDVVLLAAREVAHGPTGRNGGFCDAGLTQGVLNGLT